MAGPDHRSPTTASRALTRDRTLTDGHRAPADGYRAPAENYRASRENHRPGNGAGSDLDPRPLGSYATLLAAYGAALAAVGLALRRRMPDRLSASDLVLAGLATHKVSRVLANEKVTSPIRAPFVELQRDSETGEIEEQVRSDDTGIRRVIGELLKCPFCLSQWVASGFTAGMVVAPRSTRLVASALAVSTAADFLQIGYTASHDRA